MDIDQFVAQHRQDWARMVELTDRSRHRMTPEELHEFVALYQRSAGHLSYVRSAFHQPELVARLSQHVAAAAAALYGTRRRGGIGVFRQFVGATFPAAVWQLRRMVLVSAVLTFVPALALGIWFAGSPAALDRSAPAAVRQAYVSHDFAAYYRSEPASAFATEVYTNNVRVAALTFAGGVFLCIPTAYLLVENGANLGAAAGLFAAAGQQPKFWGLVLPHGLLELTSVVLAGAAGLRLGWTVIDPGDRRRTDALAEEGRRAVVVLIGTVFTLAAAGAIEGFVTGSGLPTALRVGIGVLGESVLLIYLGVLGPRSVDPSDLGPADADLSDVDPAIGR
ncbi:MAG: stage II sporulation protein M [Acidimicrobiales bacterium]